MLTLLIITPMISATELEAPSALDEFTNWVVYEDKDGIEDKVVTITDWWFGLGEEIGTAERITPQINHVFPGQAVQVMKIKTSDFSREYIDGMSNVEMKNLYTGKYESKSFYWEYKVEREIDVPEIKVTCTTDPIGEFQNGSKWVVLDEQKECTQEIIGYNKKTRDVWERVSNNNIPIGETEFALVTSVDDGDYYDGFPILAGQRVDKWAVWTADLNVSLRKYYNMSTNADAVGTLDLSSDDDPVYGPTDGLITDAVATDNTDKVYINTDAGQGLQLKTNFTISGWFRREDSNENGFLHAVSAGTNDDPIVRNGATTGVMFANWDGSGTGDLVTSYLPAVSTWYHIMIIRNGTEADGVNGGSVNFYYNGTKVGVVTPRTFAAGNYNLALGGLWADLSWSGKVAEFGYWNASLTDGDCNNGSLCGGQVAAVYNGDSGPGITFNPSAPVGQPPTLARVSPGDGSNFMGMSVTFNGTCMDDVYVQNCTINMDGGRIYNSTGGSANVSIQHTETGIGAGNHNWTLGAWNNENQSAWTTLNWSFNISLNLPSVTLDFPEDAISSNERDRAFKCNATDAEGFINISLWIDDVINYTQTGSAGQNISMNVTIPHLSVASHEWTCEAYDTDDQQDWAATNRTLTIQNMVENSVTTNISVNETSAQTYLLSINYSSDDWDSISANFIYNGTSHASIRSGTGNQISFLNSFDAPTVDRIQNNYSYYWSIVTVDGATTHISNTTISNQTVNGINITFCDAVHTTRAINFTIVDELTEVALDANANHINFDIAFEYWLGSGSISKNYTYNATNSTTRNSWDFCVGSNITHNFNADLVYSATDYNERTYYYRDATINNNTQHVVLKLISEALGVKFYFTVEQGAGERVKKAIVNIDKWYIIEGVYKNIGSRITDVDGKFVKYLEIDKPYRYSIVKDGILLGVVEKSAICPSAPCEDTLRIVDDGGADILQSYYSSFSNGTYSNITYNPTTQIVQYSFIDITGLAQYFRLEVRKMSMNQSIETICDTQIFSVSGAITCNMTSHDGEFSAKGYISRSPEELDAFVTFVISTINKPFAEGGLGMYAIFFMLAWTITLCFAGAVLGRGNPAVVLIMFIASLVSSKLMGLNPFSWVVNTLVIVLTAFAISKIRT